MWLDHALRPAAGPEADGPASRSASSDSGGESAEGGAAAGAGAELPGTRAVADALERIRAEVVEAGRWAPPPLSSYREASR